MGPEDGREIGGSRVHFPLHLAHLLRNKVNSQQYPSVYEDRRQKSITDTEKTDGKEIASGQKGPWDQHGDQGNCSPRPEHARPDTGLLGGSQVNGSLTCHFVPMEPSGVIKLFYIFTLGTWLPTSIFVKKNSMLPLSSHITLPGLFLFLL